MLSGFLKYNQLVENFMMYNDSNFCHSFEVKFWSHTSRRALFYRLSYITLIALARYLYSIYYSWDYSPSRGCAASAMPSFCCARHNSKSFEPSNFSISNTRNWEVRNSCGGNIYDVKQIIQYIEVGGYNFISIHIPICKALLRSTQKRVTKSNFWKSHILELSINLSKRYSKDLSLLIGFHSPLYRHTTTKKKYQIFPNSLLGK